MIFNNTQKYSFFYVCLHKQRFVSPILLVLLLFVWGISSVALVSTASAQTKRSISYRDRTVYNKIKKRKLTEKKRKNKKYTRSQLQYKTMRPKDQRAMEKRDNKRNTRSQLQYRTLRPEDQRAMEKRDNKKYTRSQLQYKTLRPEDQRAMEKRANKMITQSELQYRTMLPEDQRAMEKRDNKMYSNSQLQYRTMRPEDQRAMEKRDNKMITRSQLQYRTLRPEDQRAMEKRANKMITQSELQYRTMLPEDQRAMEKRDNKLQTNSQLGNTLIRPKYNAMLRRQSKHQADYDAGYLNTKAEKRARLRSFFFPEEYAPNTPMEKHVKARHASRRMADWRGDIPLRKRGENMHPSAEYLGRAGLRSLAAKERYRKRMLKRNRRNNPENEPVYMRKKPPRPRYDKEAEQGIWEGGIWE